MKKSYSRIARIVPLIALLVLFGICTAAGQDIIMKKNGDEIKVKVDEVLPDGIKYHKYENLDGPVYTMPKSDIFMIKYENGSKDVFNNAADQSTQPAAATTSNAAAGAPAIIYFYRPSKFIGGSAEIIVGTIVPDEVIVDLKNNHWFKKEYTNFGPRELVHGIYSVNEKRLNVDFEPGKTYYIRCSIMQGMGLQSQIELVDEAVAKKEMSGIKEQERAK